MTTGKEISKEWPNTNSHATTTAGTEAGAGCNQQ